MNDNLEGALKAYLKFLETEEYFEAHEVLEEAWHPLRLKKDPLANLLKGLINAAIAFEHIKRDRKNAKNKSQRVIVSYERYKYLCRADIVYIELFTRIMKEIEQLKAKYII